MSRSKLTAAAVQMDPKLGELDLNRHAVLNWLKQAAGQGARLIVFPECALSGYVYHDIKEAKQAAEPIPGTTSRVLVKACAELDVYVVIGILELDGEYLYNSAVLIGPDGVLANYRKTHLPVLGVDRFVQPGQKLDVVDSPVGVLGLLICYDLRFPEPPRVLALEGAELVVHPTNWPQASSDFPEFVTKSVARSSGIFLISANRVGTERDTTFLGHSQIIPPNGRPLVEADGESEMIIMAELDLALAHQKRVVHIPGV
ncbi:MAG: carbon-nitrogen hydrolase family protein, partial [Anaerolineales bacterium]|nr:carbon-nitrogen hydrolase family protein [Anaerolineales bacterium]